MSKREKPGKKKRETAKLLELPAAPDQGDPAKASKGGQARPAVR